MKSVSVKMCIIIMITIKVNGNPLVQIAEGPVSGTYMRSVNGRIFSAFRGIPYAEPPVRDLRFEPPVPKKPWKETLKADQIGNQCIQINSTTKSVVGSEDCLYLNVYTPWIPAMDKLKNSVDKMEKDLPHTPENIAYPVMVFIHGGFFVRGSADDSVYGPGDLLKKDIVLVTLNYRLGIMGFLSTGDTVCPGNFGLKDQVLALEWIQRNIHAFHGDPNRVTLFGQSAGGVCVNLHALSPKSSKLFDRYIIESGSALDAWAFRSNSTYYDNGKKVAEKYDCPTDTSAAMIKCLKGLTTTQLADTNSIFDISYTITQCTWGPTDEPDFEGAFITKLPSELIEENQMKNSSFLTGVVSEEGLIVTSALYNSEVLYAAFTTDITATITLILSLVQDMSLKSSFGLAKKVEDYYFSGTTKDDKNTLIRNITAFVSDAFFFYPELRMVNKLLDTPRPPYYLYDFRYRGTFSWSSTYVTKNYTADYGVCHGDELIYLFPSKPQDFNEPNKRMDLSDFREIDTMVDLWTNFAIHGVPTLPNDPHQWTPYPSGCYSLRIGNHSDPSVALTRFYSERMLFWYENEPDYPFPPSNNSRCHPSVILN